MSGYIIELYKNIISDENYWPEQSNLDSELKNKIYITFGEFDKMTVSRTNAFSRMRDVSKMSRKWIGDRQKLLLFELATNNQLEYREEEGNCGFFSYNGAGLELCQKLFLGVTILQFKESQEESKNSIKECLNICRKNVLDIVKEEQASVECSVFGLLGSYGVAIIWAADQFTDILKMINLIKGTDILSEKGTGKSAYQFISVFTIFAKNKDGYSEEKVSKLKGEALLQITLQTNINDAMIQRIEKEIPEVKKLHTVGEYDLMLTTPARNLYNRFGKGDIFDPSSDFYRHHILQTNVRLCEHVTKKYVEGIKEGDAEKSHENTNSNPLVIEIKEKYIRLRDIFFDKFPKTAGMVDSLDLLYGDYNSKIASVSNKMWAKDYSQQVLAILELLERSIIAATDPYTSVTTSKLLEDVQDILNCFEYQTIHLSESNNLLLDTPKCHLRYTSQNNLILYAYFGIMKDLIELAYRMQKESRQSKIIPLISVDTVPIISSFLFMDYTTPYEDRLIKFNFPMMAMYALPAYAPYLQHEIFHYVAPRDRVIRNWAKGCILAICAMKNVICELVNSANKNHVFDTAISITEGILSFKIYKAVINKYDDPLVTKIQNAPPKTYTRNEINEECGSWIQYEKQLIEMLENCVDNCDETVLEENLLYEVLHELYDAKAEILHECQDMICQESSLSKPEEEGIKAILNLFMDSLEGIFNNISPETSMAAFQHFLIDTRLSSEQLIGKDELIQLSDALKETVCDLPMIELSKLNAVSYLITYVKIQNDLLKHNDLELQIQHCIRIGVVLDNFFQWDKNGKSKQDKLDLLKSDFVRSYMGLYFSEKKSSKASCINDYVSNLENEAEKWFIKIQNWYRYYLKKYSIFSRFLQIIVKQSSIKGRLEEESHEESHKLLEKFDCLRVADYHDAVRIYGTRILDTVEENVLTEKEKREKILTAKELFQKDVFAYNIDIILIYQKQKSFEELGTICEHCFKKTEPYTFLREFNEKMITIYMNSHYSTVGGKTRPEFYEYKVRDIDGLFQTIQKISYHLENIGKKHFGDRGDALWYRGHQDSAYKLLPTAMRRYSQHADIEKSLRNYQRGSYDEFKFRMDNASEKIDKTGYTECDYLALMQHYGAPTIYMDWTENAISALYFALEAFIDPGKKDKQDDKDAVLYILHPNLYNEARNKMMDKVFIKSGCKLDHLMFKSRLKNPSSLPNLSVQYHSENFAMFLLGNLSDEEAIREESFEKIEGLSLNKDSENLLYLPLAIYASRANERVRAQSGMFMAFNIFTKPSEMKYFDYMALEQIQQFYLSKIQDATPFLYSIKIDGNIKKEIADWLKTIGVTKDMVYPELSNIGERIW